MGIRFKCSWSLLQPRLNVRLFYTQKAKTVQGDLVQIQQTSQLMKPKINHFLHEMHSSPLETRKSSCESARKCFMENFWMLACLPVSLSSSTDEQIDLWNVNTSSLIFLPFSSWFSVSLSINNGGWDWTVINHNWSCLCAVIASNSIQTAFH